MKKLIEFKAGPDKGTIIIESDAQDNADGRRNVSRGEVVVEEATLSFEKALATVVPAIEGFRSLAEKLEKAPDEVSIKFSLKFTGSAGAIIASSSIEGACEVSVKWVKPPKPPE